MEGDNLKFLLGAGSVNCVVHWNYFFMKLTDWIFQIEEIPYLIKHPNATFFDMIQWLSCIDFGLDFDDRFIIKAEVAVSDT